MQNPKFDLHKTEIGGKTPVLNAYDFPDGTLTEDK